VVLASATRCPSIAVSTLRDDACRGIAAAFGRDERAQRQAAPIAADATSAAAPDACCFMVARGTARKVFCV
jgi:hypothetical protein